MMWWWMRRGWMLLLCVALAACGGGGGDDRKASISVDRSSVAVSAGPADAAPADSVIMTAADMPDDGLYVAIEHTGNGLTSASWVSLEDSSKARILLQFKAPAQLAAGTYADTVTVHACYDEYCRDEAGHSPLTIQVRYTVTANVAGTAVASLDLSTVNIAATTGSTVAPTTSVVVSASEALSPAMWIGVSHAGSVIVSSSTTPLSSTQTRVDLTLQPPAWLGAGQYAETVTLTACYAAGCALRLQGSPLTLTVNYTISNDAQPEPGLTPLSVASRTALAHNVVDAEYSRALDAVVMASTWPVNALHVRELATGIERQLALPKAPTAVSVSPDGLYAAVGHDALITHVDLRTVGSTNVSRLLNVSAQVGDLVLAGNGYVYAFPTVDQWVAVHSVQIATNTEASPYSLLYAGSRARLHPSGTVLYTADNGLSPSDIQKYDLSAGVSAYAYDSPYHGDYAMCGDLWFKDDGSQIYTACGNTFRSSTDRTQDMRYAGALVLSDSTSYGWRILSLSQSSAAREIALIEQSWYECNVGTDVNACRSRVALYESDFLGLTARYSLAPLTVAGTAYAQRGLFVFHRASGSAKVLISRLHGVPDASAQYYLSTFN